MRAVRGLLLILDPKPHTKLLSDFVMRLSLVKEEKVLQVLRNYKKSVVRSYWWTKERWKNLSIRNQGGALRLVPKGSSVGSFILYAFPNAEFFERMHWLFTELGWAMTPAPPPRSIPEPLSFSTHVHHRDPLNAPSTSQSNAHDDDDASLEESEED
ncbi:hypothetical protein Dimus_020189 [Dionaea muscipula]